MLAKPLPRITAAVAALLAALVGLADARAASRPARARARAAACRPSLSLLAHGQGSPDDLVWDGRTLLVSDINGGKVGVVAHGRVRTLLRNLREPEGMVPGPGHSLVVAEQKTNQIVQVKLASGRRTTLAKLPLKAGQEGVDGIDAAGPGSVYVPDSARGRLYLLREASRKLSLLASGMKRPVAAIKWGKSVVVADEYSNAVWAIGPAGKRTVLGKVPLPDDLAVVSGHLITNSLVGQVWEVAPHLRMLSSAFGPTVTDPQGLVADGPGSVIVADQGRNAIYRLSALAPCL